MTRYPAAAVALGLVALLAGVVRAEADGPTLQRPSLSFNTSTVPAGRFEIETGAPLAPHHATLPAFGKHDLTDRVELEMSFDAIRRVHRFELRRRRAGVDDRATHGPGRRGWRRMAGRVSRRGRHVGCHHPPRGGLLKGAREPERGCV